MLRTLRIVGLLALLVVLLAAPSVTQAATDATWTAYYFKSPDLTGNAFAVFPEAAIAFDWGILAPFTGMPADGWSARWTRNIQLTAGTYRFAATADDGMRVFINGEKILDNWSQHPVDTQIIEKTLSAGTYAFEVQYYDAGGDATAVFTIQPISSGAGIVGDGWYGEYYNGVVFGGLPAMTRTDADLRFNWGGGSPNPLIIGQDYFSVRWTRLVNFTPGTYTFRATVDDGVRVWVGNDKIIDQWGLRQRQTFEATKTVSGPTIVKVEFFEYQANAEMTLTWGAPGTLPPAPPDKIDEPTATAMPTPTGGTGSGGQGGGGQPVAGPSTPPTAGAIVIDETARNVQKDGPSTAWQTGSGGHNGSFLYARNMASINTDYNWMRFFPNLAEGNYEVLVYVPAVSNASENVRYWVHHARGYTPRYINQAAFANSWVSLGTFEFGRTGEEFVSLSTVTFEPTGTRYVAFDAVQFVPKP